MIIIGQIILLIINVAMAKHHAHLINLNRPIKHGWWGLSYLVLAGLFSWLNHSWLFFLCSLFIRKVFFDLALNTFRGLPLFYVSKEPKSIIDKLHWRLFGFHSEWYMCSYFILTIILNLFM